MHAVCTRTGTSSKRGLEDWCLGCALQVFCSALANGALSKCSAAFCLHLKGLHLALSVVQCGVQGVVGALTLSSISIGFFDVLAIGAPAAQISAVRCAPPERSRS